MNAQARDYAEQKYFLDKLHSKTERDIFVASFKTYKDNATGEFTSASVWTKGILTWLPKTEKVALQNPDLPEASRHKLVSWRDVYRNMTTTTIE